MEKRQYSNQLFIGGALVVGGLLLFMNNLNLINIGGIWRWLPTFFIVLGIWQLYANNFRFFTGPLILIGGGFLFQLSALGVLGIDSVFDLWPLILIVIGGSILMDRLGLEIPALPGRNRNPDAVSIIAIFNGAEDTIHSERFEGGEVTAIFGGVEVNLREATPAQQPVTLNAFALFGGVEIRVPAAWHVRRDVIGIFGGTDDSRKQKPSGPDMPVDLIVTGFALFGGIDVQS
ncbi:MAG: hypothetical protein KJZ86_27715 [Caldilineaceae bacterium]|nr:hypothetical protein [Caldilineaceae bacterium]HRJ42859.1 DUF5668 domain-containing protein [Caldilineaceae bacterium]